MTDNNYIAVQQIHDIKTQYGASVNQLVNRLLLGISHDAMPMRMHLELREAKNILRQLRYADESVLLRRDETIWAVNIVKDACKQYGCHDHSSVCDSIITLLGGTAAIQMIPDDMQRKIDNEMQVFPAMAASMDVVKAG